MGYQEGVEAAQEPGAPADCRHYWIIDTPMGPISTGVCRLCGAERQFKNFLEHGGWEDNITLREVSTAGRYPPGAPEGGQPEEE